MDPHETTIYTGVVITAVVFACVLCYFAVTVTRQQRRYIQMQRVYFSHEINLLEKERMRMARDLHDEIGPLLSLSQSHINEVSSGGQKDLHHKEKACESLQRVMKRMGEIAINLTPGSLTRKGLEFSLNHFFKEIGEVSSLKLRFIYSVNSTVPPGTAIHLFRIVQEITHNTLKHASAGYLLVQFKERRGKLYVFCKDDGIGFEPEARNDKRQGLGTISLRNRTELLAGKMKCSAGAGKGTEYFFEFPNFQKPVHD